ncbi:unnamed protein product, partial [Trichobilharzia regenti]
FPKSTVNAKYVNGYYIIENDLHGDEQNNNVIINDTPTPRPLTNEDVKIQKDSIEKFKCHHRFVHESTLTDNRFFDEGQLKELLEVSTDDCPDFLKPGEAFHFRINIQSAKKLNSQFTDIFCQYRFVVKIVVLLFT